MGDIERYIIEFLCHGDANAAKRVRLSSDVDWTLRYPNLNQTPQMEKCGEEVVVASDLVYNTFFFISRAEELLNKKRDEHGRFLAQFSQFSSNEWQIPMVDEYSRLLMKMLNLPLPGPGFDAIYLTHDIDTLTQYRHLRGALGGILRGQTHNVLAAWRDIRQDPAYTFPWIMQQDAQVPQAQVIYFAKHSSGKGLDYPQYNLRGHDYRTTEQLLRNSGAQIGIHSSAYATCPLPAGKVHRSHYLSCSIDRMQQLVDAGYTDDYTMGFADLAGFRLRTTRAVRWINPKTRQLTPLVLHPLTMMDCTLSGSNYMHLNEDEAYFYASELIDKVRQHHGELNLLWHNTSIADNSYHKSLYPKLLQLI